MTDQNFVVRTATFVIGLLVLTSICLNFIYENIGFLNKALSTGPRVGLFLMLWVATWWCVKKALRSMTSKDLFLDRWGDSLTKGGLWGGINGSITWVILFGIFIIKGSVSVRDFLETFFGGLLFSLFGIPIAFVVGALVGFLGALIVKSLVGIANLQGLSVGHPPIE